MVFHHFKSLYDIHNLKTDLQLYILYHKHFKNDQMNSFVTTDYWTCGKNRFWWSRNCWFGPSIGHILLQNDPFMLFLYSKWPHGEYLSDGVSRNAVSWLLFLLYAKYGRPDGKFGHDPGRRILIVRVTTLKNYYAKTIKDRDLIFVAMSF